MTDADFLRNTPCGRLGCLVRRAFGVISSRVTIYHHPSENARPDAFLTITYRQIAGADDYRRQVRAWLRSLHPAEEKKETDDG